MRVLSYVSFLLLLCLGNLQQTLTEKDAIVYIVYLGGKANRGSHELILSHHKMLATVTYNSESEAPKLLYNYKHGFNGFAARMTKQQADMLAEMPEVVKVFPSRTLQLHTTRSWDFLRVPAKTVQNGHGGGGDVIIGMLDTGIWPESESFKDDGLSSPPSRWKGFCNSTNSDYVPCNNKIIGARTYVSSSTRDDNGHGTHTASTAGGRLVYNVSMSGVASGTARGGLPTARIAVYKVCGESGCSESGIMAAIDDAIGDGVDILSLSLGGFPKSYDEDGIAIGAFHAMKHNIVVTCSGGNSGPDESSVSNTAPWMVTVGASTTDRLISTEVKLGNGDTLKGTSLSFHRQSKSQYLLVLGATIPTRKSRASDASNCVPRSLNSKKVKNRIIVCQCDHDNISIRSVVTWLAKNNAAGVILIDDYYADVASYFPIPTSILKENVGQKLLSYMNDTISPVATLYSTKAQITSPAPVIAGFSSRGPNSISPDIIKPDVTAPGVNILAAWGGSNAAYYKDYNKDKPVYIKYNIISGTSMACPHVAGALAFLKSHHPTWSPAALKSALMTTATVVDNMEEDITDYNGKPSNPFAYGSGQINPMKALNPGLIYDIEPSDYVAYLCATGYDKSKIRIITGKQHISCKTESANLNYPSIALNGSTKTATRKLTSVDNKPSTYEVSVKAPPTLTVTIYPTTLSFSGEGATQRYTVTVSSASTDSEDWQFASLTWTDGQHVIYSPIAVKLKK